MAKPDDPANWFKEAGTIALAGAIGPSSVAISTHEPTPLLRFSKDGRLQQQWRVTEWSTYGGPKERTEWRDVPEDQ